MLKWIFGKKGGLTYRELEDAVRRNRFSDYLPWVAYDPETKVYLNIDNTIGYLFECLPLCYAGESTFSTIEGLLGTSIPRGSIIQFVLFADPWIEDIIDSFKSLKVRDDSLVRRCTEELSSFYLSGKKGLKQMQNIPIRNFRLFVALKIPVKEASQINVDDIRAFVFELLKGAGLAPAYVEPDELVRTMIRILNDRAVPHAGWDENVPISRQVILADTDIAEGWDHIKIGSKYLRCLTVKSFPQEVNPLQTNYLAGDIMGVKADPNQITSPFLWSTNIVLHNLKSILHAKCNLVLQQQAVGSFAPSLRRKQEEYLWATDEIEKGTPFVRVIPAVWVWGNNPDEAREAVMRVKRIWESKGYVMQEDRGILKILFISSLPFGLYDIKKNISTLDRDFIAPAGSAIRTVPVQTDFTGMGSPVLLFAGRKGQLVSLNLFDRSAPSQNAFIAAATGTGKSFLVNYIVFNYFASGGIVRIIDIGGSYRKICSILGGRFLEFSEESRICINPFSSVIEPENDLPVIASIVAQMAYSATPGAVPSETEMTLIKEAIRWAYRQEGSSASIDTVHTYLREYPSHAEDSVVSAEIEHAAKTLAFNLAEFTSGGSFGRWFNGPATFNISKDEFVVLELEHLKPKKDLFRVVTLQILNAVTLDLYLSDRSRPRIIVFDEAWQFIKDGLMLKDVIEEGYRRARKYRGSFITVTQSILDIKGFGQVGDVIMGNSSFKFMLESPDYEKARAEKLIDYDDFLMEILKSVKSARPRYSEIFIDTPQGAGVARLIVDQFSYWVYTSDASENSLLMRYMRDGLSCVEAIEKIIQEAKK